MKQDDIEIKIAEDDFIAEYRDRIIYLFAAAVVVMVAPFLIGYFLAGDYWMGGAIILMLSLVAVNGIRIYKKKGDLVSKPFLLGSIVFVLGLAIYFRGSNAFFWAYPLVLFVMFALPRKHSRQYLLICFVYLSGILFYTSDFTIAARGVLSIFITAIFCNIFLNVIYSLREKLLRESISDPLTGALNRCQFTISLETALERKRRQNEPVTLLSIDIDKFKSVNDDFGHDVGDLVIKGVVDLIAERKRKLDQVFRIGGEEFMLLMPLASEFEAERVAVELCEMIASAKLISERQVTVSIGVAELDFGVTAQDWLKQVDRALYEAKETGRNRTARWRKIADADAEKKKGRAFFNGRNRSLEFNGN